MYLKSKTNYRLDLLPVIPPFHLRARDNDLTAGQLVYYGPMPVYYGIGEVMGYDDQFILVDFRGTGQCAIHQEYLEPQYLIPVPTHAMAML